MPKNRLQETIFTVMMVFAMVYAMVCYNIAIATGTVSGTMFLAAFAELPLMMAIAFAVDTFVAGPIAKKLAFKVAAPGKSRPGATVLAISVFSILLICPIMSFIATVMFHGGFGPGTVLLWLRAIAINLPMAAPWQFLVAGPVVRGLFGKMFPAKA